VGRDLTVSIVGAMTYGSFVNRGLTVRYGDWQVVEDCDEDNITLNSVRSHTRLDGLGDLVFPTYCALIGRINYIKRPTNVV